MQPHLTTCHCALCGHLLLPLFSRKCESVVNILSRTSGNQLLVFDLKENQPQRFLLNLMPYLRTPLMVLMHVKPPPRQCLFIYVNLSQCVPAVTSMSVSFRFLKPMIFNTTAQWRNRQATGSILALGLCVLQCLSLC